MTTPAMTAMGMILGTAAYMAPEHAKGRAVDQRADIWAFGVVLFEMLTGRRAFKGDPALPRDLARIVRRALAKDPEKRYQTAKDLRNDLEELKASLDSGDLTAESVRTGPPATSGKVHVWRNLAIGFGVTALVAVAVVLSMLRRCRHVRARQAAALGAAGRGGAPGLRPASRRQACGDRTRGC